MSGEHKPQAYYDALDQTQGPLRTITTVGARAAFYADVVLECGHEVEVGVGALNRRHRCEACRRV